MSHIYITDNGAVLSVEGGRFKVTHKDQMIRTIPKETVESISIFGNSSITTPCMQYLLLKEIPVCYFSSAGRYFGRLESTSNNKVGVIRAQFTAFDKDYFALPLAKRIITAKINNQTIVLKRYIKEVTRELNYNVALLKTYIGKVESSDDISVMMGYEGAAAKLYFNSLSQIINPDFRFTGRNRRPPKDRFNSLLSLGYSLLMYEVFAKIQIAGMTPYYGVAHKAYSNHPALASDLMEEWRAVIVDSVVLSMIQGNEIKKEDFDTGGEANGIYLTSNGMKKFIKKFERKMNTSIKYLSYDDKSYTVRESISVQCSKLKEGVIQQDGEIYSPIRIK